jgi:hypothetical protein
MAMVAQVEASQAAASSFDAEKVILAFLADAGRLSLELPHMTTGQRKLVRRVVDQHPGQLRCESYGFGAERRLHLFKEAAPPLAFGEVVSAPPLVFGEVTQLDEKGPDNLHGSTERDHGSGGLRVKNTFIDGFVRTDDVSEAVIFRSMPEAAQMARITQVAKGIHGSDTCASARRLDLSAISETPCIAEAPSPGRSSTSASGDNIGESSNASADSMPALPQGCSVRNTFIHIAGEEAENAADGSRVVQSMPHGMFRQSLQDEIAAAQHTLPPPPEGWPVTPTLADMSFPPPPLMAPNLSRLFPMDPCMQGQFPVDPLMMPPLPPFTPAATAQLPPAAMAAGTINIAAAEAFAAFPPGSEVIIDGLLKAPAFNGQKGVVQSLDADTGRYSVLLTEGAGQWAKVKGGNLRWAMPPPPKTFAAPMLVEDMNQQQVPTWMLPSLGDTTSCSTIGMPPVLQLTALV